VATQPLGGENGGRFEHSFASIPLAASIPVQRAAIGLADLFGKDQWVPTGGANPTRPHFEALRNGGQINADALLAVIPTGLSNTFEIESRTQRGFKFAWNSGEQDWLVWGHEADAGAAAGHAGAAGWTVRIREGNRFLMAQQVNPDVGVPYNWAVANTAAKVQASHIALVVP
jgi:hypothetical protein